MKRQNLVDKSDKTTLDSMTEEESRRELERIYNEKQLPKDREEFVNLHLHAIRDGLGHGKWVPDFAKTYISRLKEII